MSKRVTELVDLHMTSGVSAFTGEPFIQVRALDKDGNEMMGQLSPVEMRRHAMAYLEAAEAAETDSILVEWAREDVGMSESEIGAFLQVIRDKRAHD